MAIEKQAMEYSVSISVLDRRVAQFDLSAREAAVFAGNVGLPWPALDTMKGDIVMRKIRKETDSKGVNKC